HSAYYFRSVFRLLTLSSIPFLQAAVQTAIFSRRHYPFCISIFCYRLGYYAHHSQLYHHSSSAAVNTLIFGQHLYETSASSVYCRKTSKFNKGLAVLYNQFYKKQFSIYI